MGVSDIFSTDPPRSRGRAGAIAALVLLAFALSLIAAAYLLRGNPWLAPRDGVAAPPPAATAQAGLPAVTDAAQTPLAAAIDPATLASREATLSAQLAALEARTAAVSADATSAGGVAGRAEALLITTAARRALDRGQGLGYLENELRRRFAVSQPRAVTVLVQAGRQPVTLEDLRQGLDTIAPDLVTGADRGWLASLRAQLGTLIVLRQAGAPTSLPADRLARAQRLLDGGQVEAARAEVVLLPGVGSAGNWLAAAHRYVLARQALDVLESAALAGQAAASG